MDDLNELPLPEAQSQAGINQLKASYEKLPSQQTPLSSIPPHIFLKKQPSTVKPSLVASQLHQQRQAQADLRAASAQMPHSHYSNHQVQLQAPAQAKSKPKTIRYATRKSQFIGSVLLMISMICVVSMAILAWIAYFYARSI